MDQNIFAHNLTFCVIHVTKSMIISAEALLKVGLRLRSSLLLAHLHTFYELSRPNLSERQFSLIYTHKIL